jgi:hypothetical protein
MSLFKARGKPKRIGREFSDSGHTGDEDGKSSLLNAANTIIPDTFSIQTVRTDWYKQMTVLSPSAAQAP